MKLDRLLLVWFGFLLSLEQGFTVVLGYLSGGIARGADVIMPVDLTMYALLLLKPSRPFPKKYRGLYNFAKFGAIAYWLWSVTGEFVALEPADFRFAYVHLSRAILVFFVVLTRVTSRDDVIQFTKGVLYALGFQAFIGVWQWQIGPVSLPFFEITNTWRSTGTIGVANAYGSYLAALAPLAIRVSLFLNIKPKWLWHIISALSLGALLASYTRGAWLGFAGAMVLFFYMDFIKKKLSQRQMAMLFLIIVAGTIFVSVKYGHVITHRMEDSTEAITSDHKHSRMGLAKDAIRIIRENPVMGTGLNNYRYHADKETLGTRIVHNTYLLVTAQQGLPGGILFVLLNFVIFGYGFRILKSKDPVIYHLGVAGMTGMLAFLVYYMVAPDYRLVILKLQHWRALAMVVAMLGVEERTKLLRARLQRKRKQLKTAQLGQGRMPWTEPDETVTQKY